MMELFQKGGPVMYVILLASIYSLAIFFERLYYFMSTRIDTEAFLYDLKRSWREGEEQFIENILKKTPGPVPKVVRAGYYALREGRRDFENDMKKAGDREVINVEGKIKHIAVIANLCPMLGLLGTVLGMIQGFEIISTAGAGNPKMLAGAISQALLTTAYGLIIAIPAILAYNYLSGLASERIAEMENVASEFAREVLAKGGKKHEDHIPAC